MLAIAAFGIALAASLAACPVITAVARANGWYDPIDHRKTHCEATPRIGGIGIFMAFVVALLVLALSGHSPFESIQGQVPFWPLILGAFLIHLLGLVDDFLALQARAKFLTQALAALLVVGCGFHFQVMRVPWGSGELHFGSLAYPMTFLWIIGITNAINLIDGMDGLAGTLAGIAASTFGAMFLLGGNLPAACLCFALVGALLGFLRSNLPIAKVFMGDSGSLFVGFVLAVLPLISQADLTVEIGFLGAAVALALPILDTLHVFLRRLGAGQSPFVGDRRHIHHRLLALGFSPRQALGILAAVSLALASAAASSQFLSPAWSFLAKISALGGTALFIHLVHRLSTRPQRVRVRAQIR